MSNDPFATPEFGFEPYTGPSSNEDLFAPPDTAGADLRRWLREVPPQPPNVVTTKPMLPPGYFLQQLTDGSWTLFVERGRGRFDRYDGTREELLGQLRADSPEISNLVEGKDEE